MRYLLLSAAVLALCASGAGAQRVMDEPLPPGSGNSTSGIPTFKSLCSRCHSLRGTYTAPQNMGDCFVDGVRMFNYVKHAMPPDVDGALKDADVYNLVAYLLANKKIISRNAIINSKTLPLVSFPNQTGLIHSGCAVEAGGFGGKLTGGPPKGVPTLIPAPPRLRPVAAPTFIGSGSQPNSSAEKHPL
jgi:hypothetical protein